MANLCCKELDEKCYFFVECTVFVIATQLSPWSPKAAIDNMVNECTWLFQ